MRRSRNAMSNAGSSIRGAGQSGYPTSPRSDPPTTATPAPTSGSRTRMTGPSPPRPSPTTAAMPAMTTTRSSTSTSRNYSHRTSHSSRGRHSRSRNSSAALQRIRQCHRATSHFHTRQYAQAAMGFESALNDARCNDPAVVVVEQSLKNSGNTIGKGGEKLDVELIVDLANRAASAHNLGLSREAALRENNRVLSSGGNNDERVDPLVSYRRAVELYKLGHAVVLSGRVRGMTMLERESLVEEELIILEDDNDDERGEPIRRKRRIVCLESSAVQSLVAAAESLASRSDVDGTIACHEEIVNFLLGMEEEEEQEEENDKEGEAANEEQQQDNASANFNVNNSSKINDSPQGPDDDHEDEPGRLTPCSTSSTSNNDRDHAPPVESIGGNDDASTPLFVKMNEHMRMSLISASLNTLGNLYARRGLDEDAISSHTDALDLLRSIDDPVGTVEDLAGSSDTNPVEIDVRDDIGRTLLSLSALHGKRGELDDAMDYGEEALDILCERHGDTYGPDGMAAADNDKEGGGASGAPTANRHPAVLAALHALGRTYDLAGDFDAAMSCYEEAFLGRCRVVGSNDLSVADVLVDMASALQRTGNTEGALELNSQALRIYRVLVSRNDDNVDDRGRANRNQERKCRIYLAGALQNRGALCMQRGDHENALDCLAEAMEIIKRTKGEDHPEVADLWTLMGDANVVRERYDTAKDCFAAALEAHRARGLKENDSPILWMLQKIRVIDDIVANAHHEDEMFLDELDTRLDAQDRSTSLIEVLDDKEELLAVNDNVNPDTAAEEFLNELATKSGSEPANSPQLRRTRKARQNVELIKGEEERVNRIKNVIAGGESPQMYAESKKVPTQANVQVSPSFQGNGTSNSQPNAMKAVSTPIPQQHNLKKASSFQGNSPRQSPDIRKTRIQGNATSEGPTEVQMVVPRVKSADETVSVITFREEAQMNAEKAKRSAKYGSNGAQPEEWFPNVLGNIAEATDTFLRPSSPQNVKSVKQSQAPISEVSFHPEIALTMSADSDITDYVDEYGGPMPSATDTDVKKEKELDNSLIAEQGDAVARVPSTKLPEDDPEISGDLGIEVDILLAQMNVSEPESDKSKSKGSSPRITSSMRKKEKGGSRLLFMGNSKKATIVTVASNLDSSIGSSPKSDKKKKMRKAANTTAIKEAKKALEKDRKTHGQTSAEAANALKRLGGLYKEEGDLDSAIDTYKQELDVRRNVDGPGHFAVADTLNRMGVVCLEKDEFDGAKKHHTEALQIQQACLGANEHNPDLSRTLVYIGDVYYKERNSLAKIKSSTNSNDYNDFIESGMLCRIAFAHEERGEFVRAIHFYDEHIELLKSKGENRFVPGIINALNCLGNLNKKIGRYVEALDYHTKAHYMQKSLPKIDKVELSNTAVLIGIVDYKAGHFHKALSLFTEALPVQQKAYGKKHAIPARTIFNMALVHDELADQDKAMLLLEQAASIQKSALPADHPDTLATRMHIAKIQSCVGMFDIAMTSLLGVLESQRQLFGPKHPCVADTFHNIGICHARRGKMNAALKSYEQSFTIRKAILGFDHPDVAAVLNSIAAVHASKKRNEKALPIYEAALKIRRDALGDRHVDVARTLSNQGVAYASLRKFPEALRAYTEAKQIRQQSLGPNHPAIGDSHVNIGNVFLRQCSFPEARKEFEAALQIYTKSNLSSDDPKIIRTKAIIDRVKRDERLIV